jgi:glycosyltransferase involved in cell wall biosynthesis
MREAARTLGLKIRLCGSELEGSGFWDGIDVDRAAGDWLEGCCAVVQPAVLEDQPRKLLRAIAEGVPVVATRACGVSHMAGVTTVSTELELVEALKRYL